MTPRRQRGVAAVEFGLLLIPLVFMAFGITEFGRALYQYNALAKSARDAVRLLSQFSPSDAAYPVAQARNLAVCGSTDCSSSPVLVPGLTTAMVKVCDRTDFSGCPGKTAADYNAVSTGSGVINLVEVRISNFSFTSLVPFVTGFTTITFGDISATMRQVL